MKIGDVVFYSDRSHMFPVDPTDTGTVLRVAPDAIPGGVLIRWHNGETDACECAQHGITHTVEGCLGEWFSPLDIRTQTITPRVVSDYTYGRCVYYSRTINGTPYRFTFVLMENGERRHFVSKYNGYCADAVASGLMTLDSVLRFACAWSQAHAIIVPA